MWKTKYNEIYQKILKNLEDKNKDLNMKNKVLKQ